MNLVLDIGNTATKWALFEGREMRSTGIGIPSELPAGTQHCMAMASGEWPELPWPCIRFDHDTMLPINLDYHTPETLGADRIADACAAHALLPGCDCLVVDAGTCITVDFLSSDGVYHGGAIMPGLHMSFTALHTFTARLPMLSLDNVDHVPLVGRSTEESILAGTLGATMLALAGFVASYRQKSPAMQVVLTGGDAGLLMQAGATAWRYEPDLSLVGLNEILLANI